METRNRASLRKTKKHFTFALVSLFKSPIEYLKGVGPQRGETLRVELGVSTFDDLLHYFPYRYIDRSQFHKIRDINDNTQFIQIKGKIEGFKIEGIGRVKRLKARFSDGTGEIELVWFQSVDWISKNYKTGVEYIIFGKPNVYNGVYSISHPEMDLATEQKIESAQGLQPLYNTSEKAKKKYLDSKAVAKITRQLLDQIHERDLPEFLPDFLIKKLNLMSRFEAYKNIHFPKSENRLQDAKNRIKFEELFLIQLRLLKIKHNRGNTVKGILLSKIDNYFDRFYKEFLPFELTGAQKRVLHEIRRDTLSGKQMNRLMQGDVGSGKTIVALLTMLMAIDNGFQACIMAPTEILAQQHFASIEPLVRGLGIEIALLTGSVKGKARKNILENLSEGKIHILIGTHALLEDTVVFKNLGMAVVDEQHRFGVAQRAKLWEKGQTPPHVLVMSATPIPRTLAMTLYGDLDVSIIDELPPGRQPIKTVHRTDTHRLQVFGFIKQQIEEGRQVYIVYPLIEESEKVDMKDLMDGYESISRAFPKPQYQIGIVHGRMKSADKDFEMQRFAKNETQILVATTVIEVGVNVPNSTIMIIENAERFGLSQLHQLRGRVGRGANQSYCILMTGAKIGYDSRKRIDIMCKTNDGFVIAEQDLKLRGPGDLDGTQQSGAVNLKLANIAEDTQILETARNAAFEIIDNDAELALPENCALKIYIEETSANNPWSKIS
ncbi:MAG TPA: ATP-dependent DNA helicase RecG [Chitinophagales bacterium]